MQKLANEAKEAKRWRSEYESIKGQYDSAKDAIEHHKWLMSDQKRAYSYIEWAKAQDNPQPTEDKYAAYSPEVAEQFRELDALKQWRQEQEQNQVKSQQQAHEQYIQQNQSKLEDHFDSLLKSKGFADDKGNVDEGVSNALGEAVIARLAKSIGDPRIANEKQVEQAFEGILKDLSFLEKRALKKAVKQPGVPASGTGVGKSVDRKIDWSNPDNRIAHLASALKG